LTVLFENFIHAFEVQIFSLGRGVLTYPGVLSAPKLESASAKMQGSERIYRAAGIWTQIFLIVGPRQVVRNYLRERLLRSRTSSLCGC
jgi:hypothetical protein